MPRYEKSGRKYDHFNELLLDGMRVYSAKGKRQAGSDEWTIGDRDKRMMLFDDEQQAQQHYDAQIAKLQKDRFSVVGDDTPVLSPWRAKNKSQANALNDALQRLDDKYGFSKTLQGGSPVMMVGARGMSRGEFFEISLDGASVVTRAGKVGKKGRTDTDQCSNEQAALKTALLTIKTNLAMGFEVDADS